MTSASPLPPSGDEGVANTLPATWRRSYPHRFQRVRHYGWRGAAAKAKWKRILALLDWRAPLRVPPAPLPPPQCPCCGKPMFLIGTLPRAPTGWRVEVKREA